MKKKGSPAEKKLHKKNKNEKPLLPNAVQYNVLNIESQIKSYGKTHHGRNELILETYENTCNGTFVVIGIVILEDVKVVEFHTKTTSKYDGIDFITYQCLEFLSKKKTFKFYFTQDIRCPSFSILGLAIP